jgi:hypothetical protein
MKHLAALCLAAQLGCSWLGVQRPTAAAPARCTTSRLAPAIDTTSGTVLGLFALGAFLAESTCWFGACDHLDHGYLLALGFAAAAATVWVSAAQGYGWTARCRELAAGPGWRAPPPAVPDPAPGTLNHGCRYDDPAGSCDAGLTCRDDRCVE